MTTETRPTQTTSAAAIPDGTAIISTIRNAALVRLETAIERLMSPTATDEDFLGAMDTEAGLKQIVREYSARLEEAAIAYIQRRGGSVETLTARFYVGTEKVTKCRDVPRAVDAVLQACGGDLDRLKQCLASGALKQGECKAVLGNEWGRHFDVTERLDMKTGKPARGVKKTLPNMATPLDTANADD